MVTMLETIEEATHTHTHTHTQLQRRNKIQTKDAKHQPAVCNMTNTYATSTRACYSNSKDDTVSKTWSNTRGCHLSR